MYSVKMRASEDDQHISGAEALCEAESIPEVLQKFYRKGFFHENGQPDFMNFKIEAVKAPIFRLPALSIIDEASNDLKALCTKSQITNQALQEGWSYIHNQTQYRGAVVLCAQTGKRLDDRADRGIRATCFSLRDESQQAPLNERVKDALAIASIMNAEPKVKGELCVSDDLHYTTGYFASHAGYYRLKNVKKEGTREGGRVIFADASLDIAAFSKFLEETPKLVIRH